MFSKKGASLDLLNGPIVKNLLLFALPIMVSNIFQQFYNAADMAIVGYFLGDKALAAVGSSAAIYELIVGFALGIGTGMSIVVARYFGANQFDRMKQAAGHTILVGLLLSLIIMLIGSFGLYPLLEVLNTPKDIIEDAFSYIFIILICIVVTFFYNLGAGLLRAIGNSLIPLLILICSSLVNIGLDILFITSFKMGVAGAAYATVLSQLLSAILCLWYIYRKVHVLVPSRTDFRIDKPLLFDLLSQGLSMGFMSSIVSIGSVILQTAVNQFGAITIDAQVSARRVLTFCNIPLFSLSGGLTTFISQNFGAKRFDRIKKAIFFSGLASLIWGAMATLVIYLFSADLIRLLTGTSQLQLIQISQAYMMVAAPFLGILGILVCLRNSLQGLNRKIEPLISSFIELFGKILFVVLVVPQLGYLGIIWCEPLIWCVMTLQLAYSFYKQTRAYL